MRYDKAVGALLEIIEKRDDGMPIGIFVNGTSVVLGGLAGCLLGDKLTEDIKEKMNWIFGICAMAMGISSVILTKNLPPVVFSVIVGTLIGFAIQLGGLIQRGSGRLMGVFMKNADSSQTELMVTAVVLFCASGTGIYGALDSGMTGNHSILIAKSVLDFFTAMIFACKLGKATTLIALPQLVVMLTLFFTAKLILPLTTEVMIHDFKACGGIILLATGLRIMQLRAFPIADMLPAMVLVMPASYIWTQWLLPVIG